MFCCVYQKTQGTYTGVSQVINVGGTAEDSRSVATTKANSRSVGTTSPQAQGRDRERHSRVTNPVIGTKRPRNTSGDRSTYSPAKRHATTEPGGSTRLKITGTPQDVSNVQEELLVLPPIPKSLYDELTASPIDLDSSVTEPESSEDERDGRKKILT